MIDASRILYEDNHVIVVNKLPGELSQGDNTGDRTLADDIKAYLKEKYNKPGNVFLGIPHRLDRPTSGAIIYAKTDKALSRLNASFKDGDDVNKTYWAVVDKRPPQDSGTLHSFITRDTEHNKSTAHKTVKTGAKEAILDYRLLASSDRYFLLEIALRTGRHHQIRAQLAEIGIHIKGDLKYGFPRSDKNGGIHLHARRLSFVHPTKKEVITLIAPVPQDDPVWAYFEQNV